MPGLGPGRGEECLDQLVWRRAEYLPRVMPGLGPGIHAFARARSSLVGDACAHKMRA